MLTTLNKILACLPCDSDWQNLLNGLGKTQPDDEPVSIVKILEICGLDYAMLCLQAVEGRDREIRLYAIWCARQVQHLMTDPRSLAALNVAEKYANGQATDAELAACAEFAQRASDNDRSRLFAVAHEYWHYPDPVRLAVYSANYNAASSVTWFFRNKSFRDAAWGVVTHASWDAAVAAGYEGVHKLVLDQPNARHEVKTEAALAARSGARDAQAAELRRICEGITEWRGNNG